MIRNEKANASYSTELLMRLLEEESGGRWEVRHCILGHIQQGGAPSPLDRIHASRLAAAAVPLLARLAAPGAAARAQCVGLQADEVVATPLGTAFAGYDAKLRRPVVQPWCALRWSGTDARSL